MTQDEFPNFLFDDMMLKHINRRETPANRGESREKLF